MLLLLPIVLIYFTNYTHDNLISKEVGQLKVSHVGGNIACFNLTYGTVSCFRSSASASPRLTVLSIVRILYRIVY